MKKIYKAKELQQILEKQLVKEYELILYPVLSSQKQYFTSMFFNKQALKMREEVKSSLMSLSNAQLLNEKALIYNDYLDMEEIKDYILLAIPKSIFFQQRNYFIGEMGYKNTVASTLCNDFIANEFIYGIGEVIDKESLEEEDILFEENKNHICFLSEKKQEQIMQRLLDKSDITIEMLEAIKQDVISFQGNSKEKKIVLETIKQKKIYEQTNQMIKCKEEDIYQKLKQDLKENDSIGLHNICVDHCDYFLRDKNFCLNHKYNFCLYDKVYQVVYNEIIEEGLEVPQGNILYTVTSFGRLNNLRKRDFFSYNYWCHTNHCNVILSIPRYFYMDGKNYYVGILSNWGIGESETLLNSVILKEKVPSEFVYGYYIKHSEKENTCLFHVNENHIHNKSLEEQETFYKNLLTVCNIDKNTLEIIEEEQESSSDVLRNTIEEKRKVFKTEEKLKIKQKSLYSLDS